jgi:hypothetical protein
VPHAWWFWKLTLLPALPPSMVAGLAFYYLAHDEDATKAANEVDSNGSPFDLVSWQETSDEFPQVRRAPQSPVSATAWEPSSSAKKSVVRRFVEAAPNPVQIVIHRQFPAWAV